MRDEMENRGPDGFGLWVSADERVALAHRRLSIIDLSETSAQPMRSQDGRYIIVFNGEIYNYGELRQHLLAKGRRLTSCGDTEVIPLLYDLYGLDMFRHLRGMYAFALWDDHERQLILARDPLGVKPLYYVDSGKLFSFASQVKPLLRLVSTDTRAEAAGHVGFMLWGNVPEPYTLFKGVRCLRAGTHVRISLGGARHERVHWSIKSALAALTFPASVNGGVSAKESLQQILRDSVKYHMVSDVPVGVFLSAGRDSATVLALAREISASSIHTLTLGFAEFDGTPNDELPLARAVAARYGTEHHEVRYSVAELRDKASSFLNVMDQPTVDGFNMYLVSEAAQSRGLKVAMSGVGADEIFQGYSSFRSIPRLVTSVRHLAAVPGLGKSFRRIAAPFIRPFGSSKYASLIELGGTTGGAYLLRRAIFLPWELAAVLDPELVESGMEALEPLAELATISDSAKQSAPAIMALELSLYLRNQLLRDTDWASMSSSVEVRTPFVDAVLFEGLITHVNKFGWPSKSLMASTPVSQLPPVVLKRPKTGFAVPTFDMTSSLRTASHRPQRRRALDVYHTYWEGRS